MKACPSCGRTYAWWRRSCFHGIYSVALTSPPAWWTRMWAWLRGERGGGGGPMTDKNPYRTLHARMSPPGAAWDEGFAAGRAAATPGPRCGNCGHVSFLAAATPDPPEPNAAIRALMAAYNDSQSHAFRAAMVTAAGVIGQHYGDENPNADEFDGAGCCPEEDGFLRAKARAAATPTPSDEEGWSPGIDDPEPPALGDIDTGEGWYQT